jgi:hypothetical protein
LKKWFGLKESVGILSKSALLALNEKFIWNGAVADRVGGGCEGEGEGEGEGEDRTELGGGEGAGGVVAGGEEGVGGIDDEAEDTCGMGKVEVIRGLEESKLVSGAGEDEEREEEGGGEGGWEMVGASPIGMSAEEGRGEALGGESVGCSREYTEEQEGVSCLGVCEEKER